MLSPIPNRGILMTVSLKLNVWTRLIKTYTVIIVFISTSSILNQHGYNI
jgi:hypothetical protein